MEDYPDWLFQGFLFFKFLKGELLANYQPVYYPVANSISTVVIGSFDFIFRPETSGKLFLSAYVVGMIASSIYFVNSLTPKKNNIMVFFALPLLFNTSFFLGNINYLMGLVFLFSACGYILRKRDNPDGLKAWPILIFSLLIFFSHAIPFFVWLLYLSLFLSFNFNKMVFKKILAGVLPSLALMLATRPATYIILCRRRQAQARFSAYSNFRILKILNH